MKTRFRIVDLRTDPTFSRLMHHRPFAVQDLENGCFLTIPGAWYCTKQEAQEAIDNVFSKMKLPE